MPLHLFSDISLRLDNGNLPTRWYQKPTDTGLILFFRALSPMQSVESIIEGMVHHIFITTCSWQLFHEVLSRLMKTWKNNQYSAKLYHTVARRSLSKILVNPKILSKNRTENGSRPSITKFRGTHVTKQPKTQQFFKGSICILQ